MAYDVPSDDVNPMARAPSRASISTVLVRPLVAVLQATPHALDAFYAATDLTPEILADAEARVSPAQFCVAWAEATRWTGDPALALGLAHAMPPGSFGIVEYVCRSAPTVREALRQWVRYLAILDDAVEVGLVDSGQTTALRVIRESEAPAPASHELCFALLVRHARAIAAGDFRVASVHFAHRATDAHAARHRAFFGTDVHFGARRTEMILDAAVLDTPLTTADANLLAILVPTAEDKRARSSPFPPLTEQVRRALRAALASDDAQLEPLARRLGMTGRSLQRRLKDEGTSFQLLRDAMRRELADRYLGEGMTFAEISFLLGFSEPSAFFRAFKRWTGLTPFERRASLTQAIGR
jgi:AraC-like DNA-binding protein